MIDRDFPINHLDLGPVRHDEGRAEVEPARPDRLADQTLEHVVLERVGSLTPQDDLGAVRLEHDRVPLALRSLRDRLLDDPPLARDLGGHFAYTSWTNTIRLSSSFATIARSRIGPSPSPRDSTSTWNACCGTGAANIAFAAIGGGSTSYESTAASGISICFWSSSSAART